MAPIPRTCKSLFVSCVGLWHKQIEAESRQHVTDIAFSDAVNMRYAVDGCLFNNIKGVFGDSPCITRYIPLLRLPLALSQC